MTVDAQKIKGIIAEQLGVKPEEVTIRLNSSRISARILLIR
jgi:acyl carrier protein